MAAIKHSIEIAEMRIGQAVVEILEDAMAKVIVHSQDASVPPEKSSVITIKVTMLPDDMRQEFKIKLDVATTLSPRKSFECTVYGNVGEDGDVTVGEYNPRQTRLEFENRI